tara:strand:+ start:106 stop:387 length:282 start_codon:yes stop_codon:yes gene_type:complete
MKQVKRNKQKVWRKTYGKPFIARKAMRIAQMAVTAAVGMQQISALNAAFIGLAPKALHMAQSMIDLSKAINDQSSEMNKGFVKNERNNTTNKI